MKDNNPTLKLQGFSNDWTEYKLSDIGHTYSGLSGMTKEDFNTGDSKYITYMNVFTNVSAKYSDKWLGRVDIKEGKNQNKVTQGDLLFTTSSETPEEVGMVSCWEHDIDNVYLNSFCFGFRIDNLKLVNPGFLSYLLRSPKYRLKLSVLAQGSTRYNLSKTELMKLTIKIPNLKEQKDIVSIFKTLDENITYYQQELEALKQTKQGFLQKMFPRETETVPQIRFKGFLGEWKSNAFSTIVERVSKQSNSDSLPKLEFEDIISGEGRLNKDISEKFDNRKGIVFEPGYILFGKLRPYLKNWLLPKFNGIALGDFWVFTTKHSPEFVYSLIQTNKFQTVANLSTGTKMPRSDWKTVSTTEFLIPSIEEQLKIGEFFRQLDEVIELKEKEIEALKETKKGFLQKMFV